MYSYEEEVITIMKELDIYDETYGPPQTTLDKINAAHRAYKKVGGLRRLSRQIVIALVILDNPNSGRERG